MKLLLLFTSLAFAFHAPDDGGTTGGEAEAAPTEEEEDKTDYEARALELGVELPAYPATPAGIAAGREELKRRVKAKEAELSAAEEEEAAEETEPEPEE